MVSAPFRQQATIWDGHTVPVSAGTPKQAKAFSTPDGILKVWEGGSVWGYFHSAAEHPEHPALAASEQRQPTLAKAVAGPVVTASGPVVTAGQSRRQQGLSYTRPPSHVASHLTCRRTGSASSGHAGHPWPSPLSTGEALDGRAGRQPLPNHIVGSSQGHQAQLAGLGGLLPALPAPQTCLDKATCHLLSTPFVPLVAALPLPPFIAGLMLRVTPMPGCA